MIQLSKPASPEVSANDLLSLSNRQNLAFSFKISTKVDQVLIDILTSPSGLGLQSLYLTEDSQGRFIDLLENVSNPNKQHKDSAFSISLFDGKVELTFIKDLIASDLKTEITQFLQYRVDKLIRYNNLESYLADFADQQDYIPLNKSSKIMQRWYGYHSEATNLKNELKRYIR